MTNHCLINTALASPKVAQLLGIPEKGFPPTNGFSYGTRW